MTSKQSLPTSASSKLPKNTSKRSRLGEMLGNPQSQRTPSFFTTQHGDVYIYINFRWYQLSIALTSSSLLEVTSIGPLRGLPKQKTPWVISSKLAQGTRTRKRSTKSTTTS